MQKLEKKYFITGEIIVKTGLMVGSSSSALEIGGTDKQIVRHPITKIPYIPGSSLKGKMRSLLELSRGEVSKNRTKNGYSFGPSQNPEELSAQVFGHIKDRNLGDKAAQRPSRLIVRDGNLTKESIDFLVDTELPYTEIKAENSIDRITAEANPRFFERVPAGAKFDLNMVLNVFDKETDKEGEQYLPLIFDALSLVQDDYLGGSGSRGNGQIEFRITKIEEKIYTNQVNSVEKNERPDLIPAAFKA